MPSDLGSGTAVASPHLGNLLHRGHNSLQAQFGAPRQPQTQSHRSQHGKQRGSNFQVADRLEIGVNVAQPVCHPHNANHYLAGVQHRGQRLDMHGVQREIVVAADQRFPGQQGCKIVG